MSLSRSKIEADNVAETSNYWRDAGDCGWQRWVSSVSRLKIICFYYADLGASNSLMCYECNSINDPRCADFDNKENIQKFQPVNCSAQLTNKTSSERQEWTEYKTTNICRKTHQIGWKMWKFTCSTFAKILFIVQGNLRVSRGCGFIPAESYDDKKCMRRTGTKVRILSRDLQVTIKLFNFL